jgi:hypothetical protein
MDGADLEKNTRQGAEYGDAQTVNPLTPILRLMDLSGETLGGLTARPAPRMLNRNGGGMKIRPGAVVLVLIASAHLGGCGGAGGSSPIPVTNHTVTLAWAPNHEKGVNTTGGGYHVSISGQPAINVPYASGSSAPASTVTTLKTGTYTVTVTAFAALDAQGGSAGSLSAPSQLLTVNVP